jgi:hypothetical protein
MPNMQDQQGSLPCWIMFVIFFFTDAFNLMKPSPVAPRLRRPHWFIFRVAHQLCIVWSPHQGGQPLRSNLHHEDTHHHNHPQARPRLPLVTPHPAHEATELDLWERLAGQGMVESVTLNGGDPQATDESGPPYFWPSRTSLWRGSGWSIPLHQNGIRGPRRTQRRATVAGRLIDVPTWGRSPRVTLAMRPEPSGSTGGCPGQARASGRWVWVQGTGPEVDEHDATSADALKQAGIPTRRSSHKAGGIEIYCGGSWMSPEAAARAGLI